MRNSRDAGYTHAAAGGIRYAMAGSPSAGAAWVAIPSLTGRGVEMPRQGAQ